MGRAAFAALPLSAIKLEGHFFSRRRCAGSTLTIYGTGFCANPTVTFNGIQATVKSASPTQIVVVVPAGAASGPVIVTCGANHSTGGTFTSVKRNPPSITSISPKIGVPGVLVTLSGSDFQTAVSNNDIRFNLSPAKPISATSTSLNTSVPDIATSGPISVTTPYGLAVSSTDFFIPPAGFTSASIAFTGQTTIGASIQVNIAKPNSEGLVVFNANAGQAVSVSLTNNTFPSCFTVNFYNPYGTLMSSNQFCDNPNSRNDLAGDRGV